jgi:hypothetical protein
MRSPGLALALLALTVAAVSLYLRTRPAGIALARSLTTHAPPACVFALPEPRSRPAVKYAARPQALASSSAMTSFQGVGPSCIA